MIICIYLCFLKSFTASISLNSSRVVQVLGGVYVRIRVVDYVKLHIYIRDLCHPPGV